MPHKPRLTHFLSLPIGHHEALRTRISDFTNALLTSDPPITGLDPSIVVAPHRLHLTLGVMSLAKSSASSSAEPSSTQTGPTKTLDDARNLLGSLQPRILELLKRMESTTPQSTATGNPASEDSRLYVPLTSIDIMKPDRGGLDGAHVMFVGPRMPEPKRGQHEEGASADEEVSTRLWSIASLLQREFIKAGLIVDEKRPLKLHVTLLNTVYRKPKPKGKYEKRLPFSYASILRSTAFQSVAGGAPPAWLESASSVNEPLGDPASVPPEDSITTTADVQPVEIPTSEKAADIPRREVRPTRKPAQVNLGTWPIDEVQICEMGSHGPEGEYVCVGQIKI